MSRQGSEILLIEEQLAHAEATCGAIAAAGLPVRITTVANDIQAFEFLNGRGQFPQAARPDLILLDIDMKRTDGRRLLRRLKCDPKLATIPVAIVTDSRDRHDIHLSLAHNVYGFLAKPHHSEASLIRWLREFWLPAQLEGSHEGFSQAA